MNESVILIPQNGIQLHNGIQPDLNPWRRRKRLGLRLRIGKRGRRFVRVLLTILLAVIIFLLMTEPVVASATDWQKDGCGMMILSYQLWRYSDVC